MEKNITDELYDEYTKGLEKVSEGLVTSNKVEFIKMMVLANVIQKHQEKELKRMSYSKVGMGGIFNA